MASIENGVQSTFQIGELAKCTALSIDAIRFYERLFTKNRTKPNQLFGKKLSLRRYQHSRSFFHQTKHFVAYQLRE